MSREKITYVIIEGTSGIGEAIAKHFDDGINIVHVASHQTGFDISDEKAVRCYFESIGAFDHLVVTARSYASPGKLTEIDIKDAREAFDIKFWGSINAAKNAAKFIKPNGSITLTTGMLARKVVVNTYTKTAINAALEAVTKVLAKELAPIRVNAVSPGLTMINTNESINKNASNANSASVKNNLPVAKVGQVSDVAMAYTMAITDQEMTGSIIDVNGGALNLLVGDNTILITQHK